MKKLSIALLLSVTFAAFSVKAAQDGRRDVKGQLISAGALVVASAGADRVGQLAKGLLGENGQLVAASLGALVLFDDASEKLVQPNVITENAPLGLGSRPFIINGSLAAAAVYGTRLAVQKTFGFSTAQSMDFYKNVAIGTGVLLGLNKAYTLLARRATIVKTEVAKETSVPATEKQQA